MATLLVEEHVIIDGPRPEGGVKNIELVRRKPGMEVGAFQDYWRGVHGPVAAGIAQLRRYEQNHVRPGAYREGRQPALDGLAIAWFDDTDAMRASAASDAYAATRADEGRFHRPGPPRLRGDEGACHQGLTGPGVRSPRVPGRGRRSRPPRWCHTHPSPGRRR